MSERRLAFARCGLGALIMLWAGVLIGVSFLAAPAKFNAATLTLPVAMDVGRQEFGTLNLAEIVLGALALALAAYARAGRTIWIGLGIAAGVIVLQGLWLLPVLDARAEMIIQGETPPSAPWHTLYIAIEVLKLLSLLVVGWLALWRPQPRRAPARRRPSGHGGG
jgi:hypothetical protein